MDAKELTKKYHELEGKVLKMEKELEFLKSEYPDALHRLEAEHENGHAMEIYKRKGFGELPYVEMVRNAEGQEK